MGILKCCVNDCNATNETHRLFCFPKNDELRKLWMSFLVPKNPLLIGLSMEQLHKKRVCERHFDKYQFDIHGQRLRHSYPCLFTEKEITHGIPLADCEGASDHCYAKVQEDNNDCASPETLMILKDVTNEHEYSKCPDDTTKLSMVIEREDNLHVPNNEENTMTATAEFVEFVDKLFDSVNGCPGATKKGKLRKAVKKNSEHHSFWTEAIKKLKEMHFIDRGSKLAKTTGNTRLVKVPSLQGWITTLESFGRLSKLLFDKYDVDYYYPRNINQDPLENFFGRIRALNYRNTNPDANTFIYTFKSLLLTNVLSPHSKFANCEMDNGEALLDVDYLFKGKDDKENTPQYTTEPLPSTSQGNPNLMEQVRMEKIKVHCSAYTAGFIARKIYKVAKCKQCLKSYASSNAENVHRYIHFRQYKMLKNNNLLYPSPRFLILYRESSQLIHDFLNVNCHKQNIGSSLKRYILTKDLSWLGCLNHRNLVKTTFVKIVVRLQVHNWCNNINKILKGDVEEKYVLKMSDVHKLAWKKYQSFRLRKKFLNK